MKDSVFNRAILRNMVWAVLLAGALLVWLLVTFQAFGQSGGEYGFTGTIGQPDAAYSTGGNYELLGGFWPGGPLCFVDFRHFARFAEHWLETGCDAGNDFCSGADLNLLGDVDLLALKLLVNEWLYYCPYGWPLK